MSVTNGVYYKRGVAGIRHGRRRSGMRGCARVSAREERRGGRAGGEKCCVRSLVGVGLSLRQHAGFWGPSGPRLVSVNSDLASEARRPWILGRGAPHPRLEPGARRGCGLLRAGAPSGGDLGAAVEPSLRPASGSAGRAGRVPRYVPVLEDQAGMVVGGGGGDRGRSVFPQRGSPELPRAASGRSGCVCGPRPGSASTRDLGTLAPSALPCTHRRPGGVHRSSAGHPEEGLCGSETRVGREAWCSGTCLLAAPRRRGSAGTRLAFSPSREPARSGHGTPERRSRARRRRSHSLTVVCRNSPVPASSWTEPPLA